MLIKKTDPGFSKKLDELMERFAGKAGDEDSESILVSSKYDLNEGFVRVSSSNKDVARLISRLGSSILSVEDEGHIIQLFIDKKKFRGIEYSFRIDKED